MNPLSRTLNRNGHGYLIRCGNGASEKVSHTFFMDDLKIYADSTERLGVAIRLVDKVSGDIGMKFGLEKCRSVQLLKGVLVDTGGYEIYDGEFIRDMVVANHTSISDSGSSPGFATPISSLSSEISA